MALPRYYGLEVKRLALLCWLQKLQNGRADSGLMDDMEVGRGPQCKTKQKRLEHGHDPRPGGIFLWEREQECQ